MEPQVDAIRLMDFWLDRWVSLDEMVDQGVLVSCMASVLSYFTHIYIYIIMQDKENGS